jgi:rubrerythrin
MYKEMAKEAREEGFDSIAALFERVAAIEKHHEERYLALAKNVAEDKVFRKDVTKLWICRNCGHIYEGPEAPEVCPTCAHPKAYFELYVENY